MHHNAIRPFDSIESTLEYMILLETTIADAEREVEEGLRRAQDARTKQAWTLAQFKMRQLLFHTQKSRRLLNDLSLIHSVMSNPPDTDADAQAVLID